MSPQDGQWRRTSLLFWWSTAIFILNINKQNVNIADETLTDYSFLSKYHYTKSKNYFKTRYQIRHFFKFKCSVYYYVNFRSISKKISDKKEKEFPWLIKKIKDGYLTENQGKAVSHEQQNFPFSSPHISFFCGPVAITHNRSF
jgi:hypothetical protein